MGWIPRLVFSLLLLNPVAWSTARACSCAGSPPPLDALARSDVVFVGMVVGRLEPPPRYMLYNGDSVQVISGGDMIAYRLVALRGWKGDPSQAITVHSMRDEAACGSPFRWGESYLVYATWLDGSWWPGQAWPPGTVFPVLQTHLCTRTRSLEWAGADLAELGEPAWENAASFTPGAPRLEAAWPNPSAGTVAFQYAIPRPGRVLLSVYDILGRRVAVIRDGMEASGRRTIDWDGRDGEGRPVASGTYFARLESDGLVSSCKIIVAR